MTNGNEIYLANVICKKKSSVNASKNWKLVLHIPRVFWAKTTLNHDFHKKSNKSLLCF